MATLREQDGKGGGRIKTAGPAFAPHDRRRTWATWDYLANRDLRALMA